MLQKYPPPYTHTKTACVSACIWQEPCIEKLPTRPPSSEAALPAAALRLASRAEAAHSYLLNMNNYATDVTACSSSQCQRRSKGRALARIFIWTQQRRSLIQPGSKCRKRSVLTEPWWSCWSISLRCQDANRWFLVYKIWLIRLQHACMLGYNSINHMWHVIHGLDWCGSKTSRSGTRPHFWMNAVHVIFPFGLQWWKNTDKLIPSSGSPSGHRTTGSDGWLKRLWQYAGDLLQLWQWC